MCYNYLGCNENIISDIRETLVNFINCDCGIHTIIYPNVDLTCKSFVKKIQYFNNLIINEQIKTINESIKMVNSKDTYIQSLFLKLFIEKVSIQYIFFYKNILNSRIKKCIEWLRMYGINMNQIVYRFE